MVKGQEPWDRSSFAKRQRKQTSKTEKVLAGWSECGQEDPKSRRQGECPSTPPTQSCLYFLNSNPASAEGPKRKSPDTDKLKVGLRKDVEHWVTQSYTMLSA